MLFFESATSLSADLFYHQNIPADKILFFDIETTGLSAQSSYVYLIGAAYLSGNQVMIRQWFMDDMAEEKELIRSFLSFAGDFLLLVHFNGSTFDVPYLQKKCKRHCLADTLTAKIQLDLYKELHPLKPLLKLSDMKQKTLEQYIGINREDPFSGGDLIAVYIDFVGKYRYEQMTANHKHGDSLPDFQDTGLRRMTKSPAKALLSVLLLHNFEDLTGLLQIAPLRFINELFCEITSSGRELLTTIDAVDEDTVQLHLSHPYPSAGLAEISSLAKGFEVPLPESVKLHLSPVRDGFVLRIPIRRDTLKYYFPDFRDYYYLPLEDRALHRSVAEFVDKAYRRKATHETCYQKKTGVFLPQTEEIFTPAFRDQPKAKLSFFETEQLNTANPEKINRWVTGLLSLPRKK